MSAEAVEPRPESQVFDVARAPGFRDVDDVALRVLLEAAWVLPSARSAVARIAGPGGVDVAVKVRPRRRKRWRWGVRRPHASLQRGVALVRAGVRTPEPLAAFCATRGDEAVEVLVTRFVDAPDVSARLLADPGQQRAWIRAAAESIAALHRAGFRHRDLKGSNVLLAGDGEERCAWILDLDGARRTRRTPRLGRRARDVGRLFVSLVVLGADGDALVEEYAACAGLDADDKAKMLRAVWAFEAEKRARNAARGRPLT